jgi:pimeloyl-ACP methyl ester carboxylesterase
MKDTSERLACFRQTHRPQQRMIAGRPWSLIVSGSGSQAIFILPGAGSTGDLGAELMFPVTSALENHFRVISVGYPAGASTVGDIVEGLRCIANAENIRTVSILGHSLGALFGKCFTQTYPDRVQSLILANFADPSPSHMRRLKFLLRITIALPQWLSVKLVKVQIGRLLKDCPDPFWVPYLTGTEAETSLQHIRNQCRCILDFLNCWPPKPWPGPVLILESDQERIGAPERQALRALYAKAKVHVLHGAGHLSWITHEREFIATVEDFLTNAGHDR